MILGKKWQMNLAQGLGTGGLGSGCSRGRQEGDHVCGVE